MFNILHFKNMENLIRYEKDVRSFLRIYVRLRNTAQETYAAAEKECNDSVRDISIGTTNCLQVVVYMENCSLAWMWLYHHHSNQVDLLCIALRRRQLYLLCLIVNRATIILLCHSHVKLRNYRLGSVRPDDIGPLHFIQICTYSAKDLDTFLQIGQSRF